MLLVPYFWDKTSNPNKAHAEGTGAKARLGLFLSKGGESVWTLEGPQNRETILEILKENGFPLVNLMCLHGIAYAEIDCGRLCMSDFYLSTEPDVSEKDVWRIFEIPDSVLVSEEFKSISQVLTGSLSKLARISNT